MRKHVILPVKEGRKLMVSGRLLQNVELEAAAGEITAVAGPDGAGKTTMMRMVCGLLPLGAGCHLQVAGIDVAKEPQKVQAVISYMPQKFGLYEDLTVKENIDLYADLHGVPQEVRRGRVDRLLRMTELAGFTGRLAGSLSGGMKQKLELVCTLVRSPELLLLDEPSVGVDPLSRRELWEIIEQLVREEKLTVLVNTAYAEEAARCQRIYMLEKGRVLAKGSFDELQGDWPTGLKGMSGISGRKGGGAAVRSSGRKTGAAGAGHSGGVAADVVVRDLVRKFGDFTAVSHTSFSVYRGEIFGMLGPNGAGKTTTFRMLCGLLPATSGELTVGGVDVRKHRAKAREGIGYVAQKFSLYGNLTAYENLRFYGGIYGLYGGELRKRISEVAAEFDLTEKLQQTAGGLPLGYRQRLSMAAALLHRPKILFLDEPTSGIDPKARQNFWRQIAGLSAAGITVIITTHFMEEAEYCDRIMIQDRGEMLVLGSPEEIRRSMGMPEAGMNEIFIAIVEKARRQKGGMGDMLRTDGVGSEDGKGSIDDSAGREDTAADYFRLKRLSALVRKEFLQISRDSSTFLMGMVLPIILIIIMGFGMSLDVRNVPVAVVLEDASPAARQVVSFVDGSEYFSPVYVMHMREAEEMLMSHRVYAAVVVPGDFTARLAAGRAEVQLILNGTEAVTAMSAQRYIEAAVLAWTAERNMEKGVERQLDAGAAPQGALLQENRGNSVVAATGSAAVVSRVWFNDANTSTWFFLPGILMMVMTLCGVFLTAVVMAREWERGTLEAIFVTPARMLEIVLAKIIPYFCVAFIGFCLCLWVGSALYDLPMRGSLAVILFASMLYIIVALGLGLTISAVTKNQFLACQLSMLVSFLPSMMLSGFLFDLHSQPLAIQLISRIFPTTHYLQLIRSLFLSGNYWPLIVEKCLLLAGYGVLFIGLAFRLTKRRAG